MADSNQKSPGIAAKLSPQAIIINSFIAILVSALIHAPSWPLVVVLIAVLAALCFRWTRESSDAGTQNDQIKDITNQMKALGQRIGGIALKVGLRGE